LLYQGPISRLPGLVTLERGEVLEATALKVEDGRITAVYVIRNPDKLQHLTRTLLSGQG
jgi:RNA polymerase sigma-70 factor (ECF subfamily)